MRTAISTHNVGTLMMSETMRTVCTCPSAVCDCCWLLVCRINAAQSAVELDPGLITEIKTHGPVLLVEHRVGCAEGVGQNDVRIVELLRLYLVDF